MTTPRISTQTLHQMHIENKGALAALTGELHEVRAASSRHGEALARLETKLDSALELKEKVDDLGSGLDKAKGAGVLMGVILGALDGMAAIWMLIHGKG